MEKCELLLCAFLRVCVEEPETEIEEECFQLSGVISVCVCVFAENEESKSICLR